MVEKIEVWPDRNQGIQICHMILLTCSPDLGFNVR
jgi:hypothetical protein